MPVPSDTGATPPDEGAAPSDLRTAPSDLGDALGWASALLAEAGVSSPAVDAQWLAAHAMGVSRGELMAASLRGAPTPAGFAQLVERRSRREPLQHIVGSAGFYGLELEVGPGVFVPRPETEVLVEHALKLLPEVAATCASPRVRIADWCTGSGAIAAALATHAADAVNAAGAVDAAEVANGSSAGSQTLVGIEAVETSAEAATYARRNLAGTGVELIEADIFAYYQDKPGALDMVCVNPPYVPDASPISDIETQHFDPHTALYGGGGDGLSFPFAVIQLAARTVRGGGVVLMEHAEEQGAQLRSAAIATRAFNRTQTLADLTGRDRITIMWRTEAEAII